MSKEEFLGALQEMLELDPGSLTGNEALGEVDAWDSMAVISFMAMADEKFGKSVTAQSIAGAKSIGDLYKLVSE
jgi:acyl carrier protein